MLVPRFGEARLASIGLILMTIGFEGLALAPTSIWLYPAIVVLSVGSSMATPSLTSLVSRRVSADVQGATLGGSQALTSLTTVVGPVLAGLLSDTVHVTAPYHTGGVLVLAATIVVVLTVLPMIRQQTTVAQ
jgi:MFS family permease